MKKYKLLLIGCFPSWEENTSCSFFSEEFAKCFGEMQNVELITCHFDSSDLPEADFALVHAYFDQALKLGKLLKGKVRKSCYFMENYEDRLGFDHYWFYDPEFIKSETNQTFVQVPLVKKYYSVVSKKPKTLLLDHDAKTFPFYGNPFKDWNNRLWNILEKDRCGYEKIAQLGRCEDKHPDFIEVIPKQRHQSYIEATKDFETYFVTHIGSYNHTAVDMAVRGIRTIVPKGFVPIGVSDYFNMIQVSNDEEIIKALKSHGPGVEQLDKATNFDDIVLKIDRYFSAFI